MRRIATAEVGSTREVKRSSRDPAALRDGLEAWLQTKLEAGATPKVGEISGTSATGMSSETLLFDASWTESAAGSTKRRTERLVARLAPSLDDAPVFGSYDLRRQFRTISLVGDLTDVPVPAMWWAEDDPDVLGTPFFVMGRVEGEPPPDVMPYNFGDSWLFDASPSDQRRLQDATIDVLVALHAIDDPVRRFDFLEFETPGDDALRRHVAHTQAWYDWATKDGLRSPLIERAFAWLEQHWPQRPAHRAATGLVWGDSRIGNVLYRDFEPAAVLDWEMAALGPPELDVAWLIYAHEVFEHLAKGFGAGGMPHFMRPDDVVSAYTSRSGRDLGDLRFFRIYAAIQYAIVFLRTGWRGVHFGEREMPEDVEEFLYNGEQLEEMIG
jgi:aminoglycoside phosphotransferase (APT) family kinase protein